jgi:hypothetical protein
MVNSFEAEFIEGTVSLIKISSFLSFSLYPWLGHRSNLDTGQKA